MRIFGSVGFGPFRIGASTPLRRRRRAAQYWTRPGRHVNHWLHFWLTLCTGGLWAPIWIHLARKHQRHAIYIR